MRVGRRIVGPPAPGVHRLRVWREVLRTASVSGQGAEPAMDEPTDGAGGMSAGAAPPDATIQEAAENAAEALALFFEDSDERPAPTPVDAVAVDPDIIVAAKVLVPAPDTDGPIERYTVTLPSGLVKRVDRRVGARRRSAFLADAVRKALLAG